MGESVGKVGSAVLAEPLAIHQGAGDDIHGSVPLPCAGHPAILETIQVELVIVAGGLAEGVGVKLPRQGPALGIEARIKEGASPGRMCRDTAFGRGCHCMCSFQELDRGVTGTVTPLEGRTSPGGRSDAIFRRAAVRTPGASRAQLAMGQ